MKNQNQLAEHTQSEQTYNHSSQKNQKTSVYSEYDNNQNSSITSRQLQYWLKQTKKSHGSSQLIGNLENAMKKRQRQALPQFGTTSKPHDGDFIFKNFENDWTFMTSKSINQPSEISFAGRVNTFDSFSNKEIQKQNFSLNSNQSQSQSHQKQTQRKQSGNTSTKSYVNAMIALQKRAKTLQEQNNMMKLNLGHMRDQRIKSMNDSQNTQEQLRMRLEELQPKAMKMEELVRENRKIRESKEQKNQRIKALEKSLKQAQEKYSKEMQKRQTLEEQLLIVRENFKSEVEKNQQIQQKYRQVKDRNRILQEMKEKSTAKILQKYNKSVQQNEEDQRQIQKLSNEISILKRKYDQRVKNLEEKYNRQSQQMRIQNEKLQFENLKLDEKIGQYRFQLKNLKQNFAKNHEEMLIILKNQERQRKQVKIHEFSSQHSQVRPAEISKDSSQFLQLQLPVSNYQNQVNRNENFARIKEVQTHSFDNYANFAVNQAQMRKRMQKQFYYSQINGQDINGACEDGLQNHIEKRNFRDRQIQQVQNIQQSQAEHQRLNLHFSLNKKSKKVQTRSLGKQVRKKNQSSNSKQSKKSMKKALQNKSENMSIKKPFQVPIKDNRSKTRKSKIEVMNTTQNNNKQNQGNSHNLSPGQTQEKPRPFVKIPKNPKFQQNRTSENNPHSMTLPWRQNNRIRDESHIFKSCQPIQVRQQQIPFEQTHEYSVEAEQQHDNQVVYLNKLLLIQSEKQTIRLYEEQERLLNVATERLSQAERAEYLGRMKQLHQQIKVATDKMFELKSR